MKNKNQTIINRIFSIILILSAVVWIIMTTIQSGRRDPSILFAPQIGFLLPDFELTDIKGENHLLSSYQGKPIVINFWASWCKPCEAEMPAIQNMYQKYNSDIVFLTINNSNQDNLTDVLNFIKKYQLEFPVLLDNEGKVNSLFQIQALPTTFFVNSNRIIQEIIVGGPMSEVLLEIRINKLMETQ